MQPDGQMTIEHDRETQRPARECQGFGQSPEAGNEGRSSLEPVGPLRTREANPSPASLTEQGYVTMPASSQ